jgi:hypothetical protein
MSKKTIDAYKRYRASLNRPVLDPVDVYRGAWWTETKPVQSGEETEAPASSKTLVSHLDK